MLRRRKRVLIGRATNGRLTAARKVRTQYPDLLRRHLNVPSWIPIGKSRKVSRFPRSCLVDADQIQSLSLMRRFPGTTEYF